MYDGSDDDESFLGFPSDRTEYRASYIGRLDLKQNASDRRGVQEQQKNDDTTTPGGDISGKGGGSFADQGRNDKLFQKQQRRGVLPKQTNSSETGSSVESRLSSRTQHTPTTSSLRPSASRRGLRRSASRRDRKESGRFLRMKNDLDLEAAMDGTPFSDSDDSSMGFSRKRERRRPSLGDPAEHSHPRAASRIQRRQSMGAGSQNRGRSPSTLGSISTTMGSVSPCDSPSGAKKRPKRVSLGGSTAGELVDRRQRSRSRDPMNLEIGVRRQRSVIFEPTRHPPLKRLSAANAAESEGDTSASSTRMANNEMVRDVVQMKREKSRRILLGKSTDTPSAGTQVARLSVGASQGTALASQSDTLEQQQGSALIAQEVSDNSSNGDIKGVDVKGEMRQNGASATKPEDTAMKQEAAIEQGTSDKVQKAVEVCEITSKTVTLEEEGYGDSEDEVEGAVNVENDIVKTVAAKATTLMAWSQTGSCFGDEDDEQEITEEVEEKEDVVEVYEDFGVRTITENAPVEEEFDSRKPWRKAPVDVRPLYRREMSETESIRSFNLDSIPSDRELVGSGLMENDGKKIYVEKTTGKSEMGSEIDEVERAREALSQSIFEFSEAPSRAKQTRELYLAARGTGLLHSEMFASDGLDVYRDLAEPMHDSIMDEEAVMNQGYLDPPVKEGTSSNEKYCYRQPSFSSSSDEEENKNQDDNFAARGNEGLTSNFTDTFFKGPESQHKNEDELVTTESHRDENEYQHSALKGRNINDIERPVNSKIELDEAMSRQIVHHQKVGAKDKGHHSTDDFHHGYSIDASNGTTVQTVTKSVNFDDVAATAVDEIGTAMHPQQGSTPLIHKAEGIESPSSDEKEAKDTSNVEKLNGHSHLRLKLTEMSNVLGRSEYFKVNKKESSGRLLKTSEEQNGSDRVWDYQDPSNASFAPNNPRRKLPHPGNVMFFLKTKVPRLGLGTQRQAKIQRCVGPYVWQRRNMISVALFMSICLIVGLSTFLAIMNRGADSDNPAQTGRPSDNPAHTGRPSTPSAPTSYPSLSPTPFGTPLSPPTVHSSLETLSLSYSHVQTIGGSGQNDFAGFSSSLSSDGTYLVVGFKEANGLIVPSSGVVRVYQSSSGEQKLWSQLGDDIFGYAPEDGFGSSVAISINGLRIAVGAFNNDDAGQSAGHVRVFDYIDENENKSWEQVGRDIRGSNAQDRAGYSVALSGDGQRVAVGAPRGGEEVGSLRVFQKDRDGDDWFLVGQELFGDTERAMAGYSCSLSTDGDVVAFGVLRSNRGGLAKSGHVSVFRLVQIKGSLLWQQFGQEITGENAGDQNGHSVSLSGDGSLVLVGANGYDHQGVENVGCCRVFRLDGEKWTQIGMNMRGITYGEQSGFSASLSKDGSRVACGGPSKRYRRKSGVVRIFGKVGRESWSQIGETLSSNAGSAFGFSVSLNSDGSVLSVGAPERRDDKIPNVGSAELFITQ